MTKMTFTLFTLIVAWTTNVSSVQTIVTMQQQPQEKCKKQTSDFGNSQEIGQQGRQRYTQISVQYRKRFNIVIIVVVWNAYSSIYHQNTPLERDCCIAFCYYYYLFAICIILATLSHHHHLFSFSSNVYSSQCFATAMTTAATIHSSC